MDFNDRRGEVNPARQPRIEWNKTGKSYTLHKGQPDKQGRRRKARVKLSTFDEEANPRVQERLGWLAKESEHAL